jgi:hypothetical protein
VIWQEGGEKGQSGHTPGEKRFAQMILLEDPSAGGMGVSCLTPVFDPEALWE